MLTDTKTKCKILLLNSNYDLLAGKDTSSVMHTERPVRSREIAHLIVNNKVRALAL